VHTMNTQHFDRPHLTAPNRPFSQFEKDVLGLALIVFVALALAFVGLDLRFIR
jgi:hypothetical protein